MRRRLFVLGSRSGGFQPPAANVAGAERFIAADVARNAELLRIANFRPE